MNLWVEKYRPTSFSDLVDQTVAIRKLDFFIESGSIPHMIFTGPPGTGKTSAAHILVKKMFPESILKDRVLELNASEERGIRTVRGKIKRFVSASIQSVSTVNINIVILDEADALTLDSQYALRRVMEDSSKNARFILICNYINRIITPLLSRCAIIHFNTLSASSVRKIIEKVCDAEKVTSRVRRKILDQESTDARYSINMLQRMAVGKHNPLPINIKWKSVVNQDPYTVLTAVEDMILDGFDIDILIEDFVSWATEHSASPAFLDRAISICCNVSNHGTPTIQLTSLILSYVDDTANS